MDKATIKESETSIPWAWIRALDHLVETHEDSLPAALPVEILPWLYLGDQWSVSNVYRLKELGISHVLSVNGMPREQLKWIREEIFQPAGIIHKHVQGEDEEFYDMIGEHWEECKEFLATVRNNGGRVVVHCAAGINRSGLIACAAHMVLERKPVLSVVQSVISKRGYLLWNKSFRKQLCILAANEGLLGEKPVGFDDAKIVEESLPPPPQIPKQALAKLLLHRRQS
jgi:hypothetical protein